MNTCMHFMHPPKIVQIELGHHVDFCVCQMESPCNANSPIDQIYCHQHCLFNNAKLAFISRKEYTYLCLFITNDSQLQSHSKWIILFYHMMASQWINRQVRELCTKLTLCHVSLLVDTNNVNYNYISRVNSLPHRPPYDCLGPVVEVNGRIWVNESHSSKKRCCQQTIHWHPGPRLNIRTVFPRYGDSHVKDKTVGKTVLSLTWKSLYW